MPAPKLLLALLGALGTLACRGPERGPEGTPESVDSLETCFSAVPLTRWTAPGGEYTRGAASIDELSVSPAGGLAATDSGLFLYDGALGLLWRTAPDLGQRTSSGRFGGGPGEFDPVGRSRFQVLSAISWIDAIRDSVVVFDGAKFLVFDAQGVFVREDRSPRDVLGGLPPVFTSRLRAGRGALFLDFAEPSFARGATPDRRKYRIWRMGRGKPVQALEVTLPALPTDREGAPYTGPEEARPVWDVTGNCVVFSDGGSNELIVAGPEGRQQALRIPLPDRMPDLRESRRRSLEVLETLGNAPRDVPDPAVPRRVLALAVDPDGWIWVLPRQPPNIAGLEILLLHPGTGEAARVDTVPAWPETFGRSGEFYGFQRDRDDLHHVSRFTVISPR